MKRHQLPLRAVIAFVVALSGVALSGCGTTPPMPDKRLSETLTGTDKTPLLSEAVLSFSEAYAKSSQNNTEADAALLLKRGKTLLQIRCADYMDAIGMSNQAASNVRQQVGLSGGFISALMGITGSTAKQVAGVSSLFSFSGASFDAYTTAYLFADAGTSVIQLVRKAQIAYMDEAESNKGDDGYDHKEVMDILLGYEAICRPGQIRSLIKDAISKAEVVADIDPVDVAGEQELASMLEQIRSALGLATFVTEAEAVQLYQVYLGQIKGPVSVGGTAIDAAQMKKLSIVLTPLSISGSKLAKRWKGILAKEAANAKAADAKKQATDKVGQATDSVQKAEDTANAANTAKPADPAVQAANKSNEQTKAGLDALQKGNIEQAAKSIAGAQKSVQAGAGSVNDPSTADALKTAKEATSKAAEALQAARNSLNVRALKTFRAPVLSVK